MDPTLAAYMKIAQLTVLSVCAHITFIPPAPRPHRQERAKFAEKRKSSFGEEGFSVARAARLMVYTLYITDTFHILAVLSSLGFPSPPVIGKSLLEGNKPSAPSYEMVVGTSLLAAGTVIRVLSYRALDRFFTADLAIREGHRLVTSGPYSVVRHPGYAAAYLSILGLTIVRLGTGSSVAELKLWQNSFGVVAGAYQGGATVYMTWQMYVRMPAEDAVLRKEFGDDWDVWARRTPYRPIPGIYSG
ncbi:isoprenylcysteine carboxylmethyltransferase family protein [Phanerochaete sordida]|uniref:Isoprenylcysteine carboxylmethyltransferase family protein n=1 Tax=Phanerochaete sordida TaxID=48140 RepID=A0A9P3LF11_9APHY|nr:isoprenylcysteine carboxylmethyltransferase family protein [Phanerochaete sordida]